MVNSRIRDLLWAVLGPGRADDSEMNVQRELPPAAVAAGDLVEIQRVITELGCDWAFVIRKDPDGVWTREWIGGSSPPRPDFDLDALGADAWREYIVPEDQPQAIEHFTRAIRFATDRTEFRISPPGTDLRWVESTLRVVRLDTMTEAMRVYGTLRDITARRATEEALRDSESEHRALVEQASDAILVIDEWSRINKSNPAALDLFGLEREVLHARKMTEFFHPDDVDDDPGALKDLANGMTVRSVRRLLRGDGEWAWAELSARRLRDGRIQATARDITDRIKAEHQIRDLASFDSLTGLPNRELFNRLIAQELERGARSQMSFALLSLDIDRFKQVNDSIGRSSGDLLLKTIAKRLKVVVRETDSVGRWTGLRGTSNEQAVHVSRLGGDEFTVLITRIGHPQDAARVARRVIHALSRPCLIAGQEIFPGASIGIAVWPDDGDTSEILFRSANTAMFHAKKRGGNVYQFFNDSMDETAARRLDLETKLRRALERGEFKLVYQPIRDPATGMVLAAETLLRWTDSEGEAIGPDELIPIAEETGLIVDIGVWVLKTACRQAREWQAMGYEPIRLAVNISVCQLRDLSIVEDVDQIFFETGLSPAQLELEITESSVLDSNPNINASVAALMEKGIGFALDAFGTGYSSLSALQRFPIDRLKIDRSLVAGVGHRPADEALVSAIVALGKRLDLKVVASGVEEESQAQFLTALGCDELQGYLFGRPLPAEEFEAFLTRRGKQSSWGPDGL
ncbi:MAG: EAL domain-containing protein [Myxococcota bacterium]